MSAHKSPNMDSRFRTRSMALSRNFEKLEENLFERRMSSTLINMKEIYEQKMVKAKFITFCNSFAIMIEIVAIVGLFYFNKLDDSNTPLSMQPNLIKTIWIFIFLLQETFALLPLFYNDDDFYDILCDKINMNFAIIWIGFTLAFMPLIFKGLYISFMSPTALILLKLFSNKFIYNKIKYHDEGNAFVSRSEFFALHITFSLIEAWISYLMLFSVFQAIIAYLEDNGNDEIEKDKITQTFGITAMILIMCELTYYLAYYKDIVFAYFNCLIFSGILYRNYVTIRSANYIQTSSIVCFSISFIYATITLFHSFESAFYLKYFSLTKKLRSVEHAIAKSQKEIEDNNVRYIQLAGNA